MGDGEDEGLAEVVAGGDENEAELVVEVEGEAAREIGVTGTMAAHPQRPSDRGTWMP